MAGQQFEYDERGSTFYYFVTSFYACVLVPLTYYFWPRRRVRDPSEDFSVCHCDPCLRKQSTLHRKKPAQSLKTVFIKFYLVLGWIGLVALTYKAFTIEAEGGVYDPYAVLGLSSDASASEVRKQYHRMSLKYHPDRGGDPKKFVAISKAYQSLTDEDTRRNYEEYGNPDGPEALRLGIALPSWLISKEYAVWVIGFYVFLFMILLPIGVGTWWFRSIKYNPDSVLLDTTQLYFFMFHKSSLIPTKRLVMILAASFEFCRSCNRDVVERPSDDSEVPALIKMLSSLGENKKERPLCYPYSVKARALLHAHFSRLQLPEHTLRQDLTLILKKCPTLVQEMINMYLQLVAFAATGRVSRMPALETLENTMKLSSMVVQAVWDHRSPLLQLPYFNEDNVRHLQHKRRFVKTCADLAQTDPVELRSVLRFFSDEQYSDVLRVLSSMPKVEMSARFEVQDDEDKSIITAGSLVTCVVKLVRKPLLDTQANNASSGRSSRNSFQAARSQETAVARSVSSSSLNAGNLSDKGANEEPPMPALSTKNQRKVWERQKRRKGGKSKKKGAPPVSKAKAAAASSCKPLAKEEEEHLEEHLEEAGSGDDENAKALNKVDNDSAGSLSDVSGEAAESNGVVGTLDNSDDEDEDDLLIDELAVKREQKCLEAVSKITHPVHCPYFPDEKYEWWWIFICDRKRRVVVSPPIAVTNLKGERELEMKFPAPNKPGKYVFQVCLRSDSYLDADQAKDVKFDVHSAREIVSHPQWDFTEEKSDVESDEEYDYTEGSEEDDELSD